jgi:outer membrane protein OmpA-like peptidoglycan-associated protein
VNPESSEHSTNGTDRVAEFDALRRLLVGPEQSKIEELSEEIQSRQPSAEELADKLPEAIALRGSRDEQLGRALGPTIDIALRESIRRDPQEMATAIFPVLGPAIRKAIAETMAGLVHSINAAVEQSLSVNGIKWRVEAWRTGVPYPDIVIKRALVYRVEQAFLVHSETGLLLEHVSAPDLSMPDADLISSMLTAIQDFVRDSFKPGEGAMLRTFSVGDHTVQVEAGPRASLAVVIRGNAPESVLRKQQDALETVHMEFATPLADFTGDSTPFLPTRPLLEGCLETVLTTSKQKHPNAWMKWAIPLALVVAIAAAFWIRSTVRWNRALNALRDEPGLGVGDASRKFGSWKISGLRDPIARDPASVLAGIGMTQTLTGKWEGYLSLDPVLVRARARASIDSLKQSVESDKILFAAGSADLDAAGIAKLTSIANRYRRLEDEAAGAGSAASVELIGRTDPSGADETNAALADRRVQTVSRWFESSGIPTSHIAPRAIAAAQPIAAPDSATQARVNRSVSFRVRFSPVRNQDGAAR